MPKLVLLFLGFWLSSVFEVVGGYETVWVVEGGEGLGWFSVLQRNE